MSAIIFVKFSLCCLVNFIINLFIPHKLLPVKRTFLFTFLPFYLSTILLFNSSTFLPSLYAQPTVIITEVLAYEDAQLQFIELYNQTTYQIDLNRYILTVSSSPNFNGSYTYRDIIMSWPTNIRLPHTDVITNTTCISPYQYALIISTSYADSNKTYFIPSNTLILTTTDYILSKKSLWSTDRIRLSQSDGVVISTFGSTFIPFTSWGVAIERKGEVKDNKEIYYNHDISDNWSTSRAITGSTPGALNSHMPNWGPYLGLEPSKEQITKIIQVSNSPFFPHGDFYGKPTEAAISYNVPENTTVTLKIFDIKGNLILTPIDQDSTGLASGQKTYYWNGRDENGNIVPIGVYICYIEAIEPTKGKVHKGRAGVVVGRKLD